MQEINPFSCLRYVLINFCLSFCICFFYFSKVHFKNKINFQVFFLNNQNTAIYANDKILSPNVNKLF